MKKLATLMALAAALAVSAPVVAQARHSADDPVTHIRHGAPDDRAGATQPQQKAEVAQAVRTRRGADDPIGHDRGGHGGDDGPNHT